MLIASVGPTMAANLGVSPAFAGEVSDALDFGDREPLVPLYAGDAGRQTAADARRQAESGARTSRDWSPLPHWPTPAPSADITTTAITPSWPSAGLSHGSGNADGSKSAAGTQSAAPQHTLHASRRRTRHESLHQVEPAKLPKANSTPKVAASDPPCDAANAEKILAAIGQGSLEDAYNQLQLCIQDDIDVHRVVLSWRSWATLDLTGRDAAITLLRQSVQFCVDRKTSVSRKSGRTGRPQHAAKVARSIQAAGPIAGRARVPTTLGSTNSARRFTRRIAIKRRKQRQRLWPRLLAEPTWPKRSRSQRIGSCSVIQAARGAERASRSAAFTAHRSEFTHPIRPTLGGISPRSSIAAMQSPV